MAETKRFTSELIVAGAVYEHVWGGQYEMIGLVKRGLEGELADAIRVGTESAQNVEDYELTKEVREEEIDIFMSADGSLLYRIAGECEVTGEQVVYIQQSQGEKYGKGKLWFRSPENFQKNFRLVSAE